MHIIIMFNYFVVQLLYF